MRHNLPDGILRKAASDKRSPHFNSLHDAMVDASGAAMDAYKPMAKVKELMHTIEQTGRINLTEEDHQILDSVSVSIRQMVYFHNRLIEILNGVG